MSKKWIFIILVFALCATGKESRMSCRAGQNDSVSVQNDSCGDSWFGKDKGDHLVMSAFFTGLGYYGAQKLGNRSADASRHMAAGFALTIGLSKEAYDKFSKQGMPSAKDILADVLGIFLGYLMLTAGT